MYDTMTNSADHAEIVNNCKVTLGKCVYNESHSLLVVICSNVLFQLFTLSFYFKACGTAKTNAFYKTLGHNFAVFHVDELELQRRAPAVHD